ncbi:hypothetical protein [Acanthopleuribacter pedis]|uniref:PKD domain-containing protein n=1 Tax=Acanthopleuribacter pedis TaxID=442870 RepID=A0A8J7QAX8_9BACT|nr:hypothetical protein [Acanthopleuribacter pedis]MBO1320739.1 hypothetical protein [Acanthopleuribacter pedis]
MMFVILLSLGLFQPGVDVAAADTFSAAPWHETAPGVWEKEVGSRLYRLTSGSEAFVHELDAVSAELSLLDQFEEQGLNGRRAYLAQREAFLEQALAADDGDLLDPRHKSVSQTLGNISLYADAEAQAGLGRVAYQGPCYGQWSIRVSGVIDGRAEAEYASGSGISFNRSLSKRFEGCGTVCSSEVVVTLSGCTGDGRYFSLSVRDVDQTCAPVSSTLNVGAWAEPGYGLPSRSRYFLSSFASGGCGPYQFRWTLGPNVTTNNNLNQQFISVVLNGRTASYVTLTVTDARGTTQSRRITLRPHDGDFIP